MASAYPATQQRRARCPPRPNAPHPRPARPRMAASSRCPRVRGCGSATRMATDPTNQACRATLRAIAVPLPPGTGTREGLPRPCPSRAVVQRPRESASGERVSPREPRVADGRQHHVDDGVVVRPCSDQPGSVEAGDIGPLTLGGCWAHDAAHAGGSDDASLRRRPWGTPQRPRCRSGRDRPVPDPRRRRRLRPRLPDRGRRPGAPRRRASRMPR